MRGKSEAKDGRAKNGEAKRSEAGRSETRGGPGEVRLKARPKKRR